MRLGSERANRRFILLLFRLFVYSLDFPGSRRRRRRRYFFFAVVELHAGGFVGGVQRGSLSLHRRSSLRRCRRFDRGSRTRRSRGG